MEDKSRQTREEFPGNSYTKIKRKPPGESKSKEAVPSPTEKKGRVHEKKKTIGERIAENFLATDREEIQDHVLFDFLVPGIKTIIEDIVHMILFGSGADSRIIRERGESRPRYVSYDKKYDERRRRNDEYITHRASRRPELTFDRRSDAEQVLSGMFEFIDDYGQVTLKDFYNIVADVTDGNISVSTDYTMTRYGWRDLSAAAIVAVRGGYLLKLPRADVVERR